MKRVTLTFVADFDDEVSDEDAIESAVEIVAQDHGWPGDDDVKVETIPGQPEG